MNLTEETRATIVADPALSAWSELLSRHDFSYQHSEDRRAYDRGHAERQALLHEARSMDRLAVLALVEARAISRLGPEAGPMYFERFREDLEAQG